MLEAAIEAGAEDVASSENGHEIYTTTEIARATWPRRWRRKFGEPRKAALVWKPKNTVALDDERARRCSG